MTCYRDAAHDGVSFVAEVELGIYPGYDLIHLKDGRVLGIDQDGEMRIFLYEDAFHALDGDGDCIARFPTTE